MLGKQLCKMTLMGKSRQMRNIRDRQGTVFQQSQRLIQPVSDNEVRWRIPHEIMKKPKTDIAGNICRLAELLYGDPVLVVTDDIIQHLFQGKRDLPVHVILSEIRILLDVTKDFKNLVGFGHSQ